MTYGDGIFAQYYAQSLGARAYVQDGLIAMWDGIENAGWGVHDGSTTVWKDLVGTDDGILYDTGSWLVDGRSNGNGSDACMKTSGRWGVPYYLEVVALLGPAANSANNQYFKIGRYGSLYKGRTTDVLTFSNGSARKHTADTLSAASIYSIGIYFTSTGFSVYVNGEERTVLDDGEAYSGENDSQFYLRNCANGVLYCVRKYIGALTVAEIAHNYAIDKARFNIQ